MKPATIETIIRHIKGILAALEKEKAPKVPLIKTFNGKNLNDLSEDEIKKAWEYVNDSMMAYYDPITESDYRRELYDLILMKYSHLVPWAIDLMTKKPELKE
jgi:hypothetical protein